MIALLGFNPLASSASHAQDDSGNIVHLSHLISKKSYKAKDILAANDFFWKSRTGSSDAPKWREEMLLSLRLKKLKKKELSKACDSLFSKKRIESLSKSRTGQLRIYFDLHRAAAMGFEDFDDVIPNFEGQATYAGALLQLLNKHNRKIEKKVLDSFENKEFKSEEYSHAFVAMAAGDVSAYVVKALMKLLKDEKQAGKHADIVTIFQWRYQGSQVNREALLDSKKQKEWETEYQSFCETHEVKNIDYLWGVEQSSFEGGTRRYGENLLLENSCIAEFKFGTILGATDEPQVTSQEFRFRLLPLEETKILVTAGSESDFFNPVWDIQGSNGRWEMKWSNTRNDSISTKLEKWLEVSVIVTDRTMNRRSMTFNCDGSQLISQEPFEYPFDKVKIVILSGRALIGGVDYSSPQLK